MGALCRPYSEHSIKVGIYICSDMCGKWGSLRIHQNAVCCFMCNRKSISQLIVYERPCASDEHYFAPILCARHASDDYLISGQYT